MTDALSTDTQYLVRIANAAEAATPAGTAYMGKTGMVGFKILKSFTRPSDTPGAYTALDAISNSTSSPAIMTQDLASLHMIT